MRSSHGDDAAKTANAQQTGCTGDDVKVDAETNPDKSVEVERLEMQKIVHFGTIDTNDAIKIRFTTRVANDVRREYREMEM